MLHMFSGNVMILTLTSCVGAPRQSGPLAFRSVSNSHAVGRRFVSQTGNNKDHHKNGTNCLRAQQRSPVINHKSSVVLYPGPGFLSCATWPFNA